MFRIQRIAWFDIGYNICVSLEMTSWNCSFAAELLEYTIFHVKVDMARAVRTWHADIISTAPCWLRNDRSHGQDSAEVRVHAVFVQGW